MWCDEEEGEGEQYIYCEQQYVFELGGFVVVGDGGYCDGDSYDGDEFQWIVEYQVYWFVDQVGNQNQYWGCEQCYLNGCFYCDVDGEVDFVLLGEVVV